MTEVGIYGATVINGDVIKTFRLVMAGPAAGRVPAIPLRKAPPGHRDRDHRDAPLRGGPAMTKECVARAVIYGNLGNRNRHNINTLLIDDRRWHLWHRRHLGRRHQKHFGSSWPGLSRPSGSTWRGHAHRPGSPGLAAVRRPADDAGKSDGQGHL